MSYGYVPPPIPPPPSAPRETWFSRNWKWFLPTVILVPVLLIVLFVGGSVFLVFGMMKSSEPYRHAVEAASHDPRVLQKLGAPIVPDWYVGGRFNSSESSGYANLLIPLKGQLRHATVLVWARESEGKWSYQRLRVQVDGEPATIDLLSAKPSHVDPLNQTPTPEDEDK
jgi:hypothetical protein